MRGRVGERGEGKNVSFQLQKSLQLCSLFYLHILIHLDKKKYPGHAFCFEDILQCSKHHF